MHGEQRVRPPCKKPSSSDRIGDPLGRDQPLVAEYASRLQEVATSHFGGRADIDAPFELLDLGVREVREDDVRHVARWIGLVSSAMLTDCWCEVRVTQQREDKD